VSLRCWCPWNASATSSRISNPPSKKLSCTWSFLLLLLLLLFSSYTLAALIGTSSSFFFDKRWVFSCSLDILINPNITSSCDSCAHVVNLYPRRNITLCACVLMLCMSLSLVLRLWVCLPDNFLSCFYQMILSWVLLLSFSIW
jgi:hypothetical protein